MVIIIISISMNYVYLQLLFIIRSVLRSFLTLFGDLKDRVYCKIYLT